MRMRRVTVLPLPRLCSLYTVENDNISSDDIASLHLFIHNSLEIRHPEVPAEIVPCASAFLEK